MAEDQKNKTPTTTSSDDAKVIDPANVKKPSGRMLQWVSGFFRLRQEPSVLGKMLAAGLCLGLLYVLWWLITRGAAVEDRIVSPATLPSPAEVFSAFPSLWFDGALTRNTMASLVRVLEGYGLALVIGVPIGILGGCFRRFNAFLAPITIFGRNVPVATLIPLTVVWFGIDELQKVMFIFIACVAFVVSDVTETIVNVDQKYLDTAYTLGASRFQVIYKVLVPLSLPNIFNSMRMLFGLGFGYIILAEVVNMDTGLGTLISNAQKRGLKPWVYLCLIVITLVAYGLDRLLFWIGQQLFPYRCKD